MPVGQAAMGVRFCCRRRGHRMVLSLGMREGLPCGTEGRRLCCSSAAHARASAKGGLSPSATDAVCQGASSPASSWPLCCPLPGAQSSWDGCVNKRGRTAVEPAGGEKRSQLMGGGGCCLWCCTAAVVCWSVCRGGGQVPLGRLCQREMGLRMDDGRRGHI